MHRQQQIDNAEAYRQHIVRDRTLPDLLVRRGDHRLSHASRSGGACRAAHRARDRLRRWCSAARSACTPALPTPRTSISARCAASNTSKHRATFVVPVNAPGVTVICRRIATRDANPFASPLSSRYDELDGQMWLDDVHRSVGTHVPGGSVAGADRALAVLASAVLLAVEGGVHAGPGAGLHPCDGAHVA